MHTLAPVAPSIPACAGMTKKKKTHAISNALRHTRLPYLDERGEEGVMPPQFRSNEKGAIARLDNPASTMTEICRVSDVPAEGGLRIVLPGRPPLAVFRVGDDYLVIDDTCTHGEASLSEGVVEGTDIVCPYHLGAFCLKTGEPTAAPCSIPLRTYPAERRGDRVFARLG